MGYFDKCKNQFGSIHHGGAEYALCDNAVIDNFGTNGDVIYRAYGVSRDQLAQADTDDSPDFAFDPHVVIVWTVNAEWYANDDTDESNACQWDKPYSVTIVG